MSASNHRFHEYDTVHHLVSRIAHKVYFLGDDERNDLLDIVRRAAAFGGLRLLGWCVMTNHFHLLVHLPPREEVSDSEVLHRVGILKGSTGLAAAQARLAQWRMDGDEQRVKEWFDRQRARMYDIGEFMKTVKQWFTEDYNQRQSHVGTLWESVYHDHLVPMKVTALSSVLAYIHLNPIRAGVCRGFGEYAWSSFSALVKGDSLALEGLRYVLDDQERADAEIIASHSELMEKLLREEQKRRADAIARKRAAGFAVSADHLTDEAMIAQAAAQVEKIQQAVMGLKEEGRGRARRRVTEQNILSALAANPDMETSALAEQLDVPLPTIYRILRDLQKRGALFRLSRTSPWIVKPE